MTIDPKLMPLNKSIMIDYINMRLDPLRTALTAPKSEERIGFHTMNVLMDEFVRESNRAAESDDINALIICAKRVKEFTNEQ